MFFLKRGIFWNVWGFPNSMWNIEVGLGKFLILEKLRGIGLAFVGWCLFISSRQKLHILALFYREMHFKFVKLITSSMEVRCKSYSSLSSRATVSPNLGASFLLSRWCSQLTVPQAEESAVERCVQLLEHAGECRARGVCVDGLHCYRARRVLLHHRACPTQQCSVCRQLEPLCHLHASRCQVITGSFITHHHLC